MRAKLTIALFALFIGTIASADKEADKEADEEVVKAPIPAHDPELINRLAQSLSADHGNVDRFDAEVWLRVSDDRLAKYLKNRDLRLNLLRLVYREAQAQKLDPDLVLAVMQVESRFERFAVSSAGAQGLMQVMPFWRLEIGRDQDNLTDPETNIRYGTTILAHYLERSKGDMVDALGRYNGSRGKLWYPELVLTAWRRDWRNKSWGELPALRLSCSTYALRACLYQ